MLGSGPEGSVMDVGEMERGITWRGGTPNQYRSSWIKPVRMLVPVSVSVTSTYSVE